MSRGGRSFIGQPSNIYESPTSVALSDSVRAIGGFQKEQERINYSNLVANSIIRAPPAPLPPFEEPFRATFNTSPSLYQTNENYIKNYASSLILNHILFLIY